MLSSLPSLAPRDSHSLWYSPTHQSSNPSSHQEPVNHAFDHLAPPPGSPQNLGTNPQRRSQHGNGNRSPLARLRADELYMERRKQNVQNYGSSWIKPPGVLKSLHQLREERREMEEHQEALRREQLAQELAEAEAGDELLQGEGADGELEAARDLDDDIPEAETTGIGDDDSDTGGGIENDGEAAHRGGIAQRMPEEAYREALLQGQEVLGRRFTGAGGSDTDEDDQSQMLVEEDLVHETEAREVGDMDTGMDMDADLDDDVPDAEPGEYEHTDTEAELSTSDDESEAMDSWPQGRALSTSMVRSDGTQNSLELGNSDLRSDISMVRSSPRQRTGFGRYREGQH